MNDTTDLLVFLAVVGLRLFVPLLIPRFPLPAVIAIELTHRPRARTPTTGPAEAKPSP